MFINTQHLLGSWSHYSLSLLSQNSELNSRQKTWLKDFLVISHTLWVILYVYYYPVLGYHNVCENCQFRPIIGFLLYNIHYVIHFRLYTLNIYLLIYLSVHLNIYLSIHLMYLSIHLIYLCIIYLSIYLNIYVSNNLNIYQCIHLIYLYIHLIFYLCIH